MATENKFTFMGVDYGAKLAGTTAAAMVENNSLQLWHSIRGQDADEFLLKLILEKRPSTVFIDAPLTLPKVYSQSAYTSGSDFFYRACDREVQAMSPMFIGGLTARAIKLRTILAEQGIAVLETYPSQLAHVLLPDEKGYKKDLATLPIIAQLLQDLLVYKFAQPPQDWHQFDALLAWFSGYRHLNGEAILYGEAHEGRIIV
ncbi:DUF429 domain-containing protein [Pontibacter fetidus]|uniref:DUF429 domain-containing protein n=1 Tax=Pontibacter fetidus TaxID=2700082 RepID=A0A6B2GYS2_9BACT|nr:DUF429 domain-containing protein [Pontibacter fetidus]NDK56015.1 DUF429 domain-containing protein [Pontibacter fetidus]